LSLDPNTTEGVSVATYFYSYVVHVTDWHAPDYNIGDLAESWETPDDTHWIFNIRGDAKFRTCRRLTGGSWSGDIVKSIDRYRSMPAPASWDQWTSDIGARRPTFSGSQKPYGYF
jgi:hypothetical protein